MGFWGENRPFFQLWASAIFAVVLAFSGPSKSLFNDKRDIRTLTKTGELMMEKLRIQVGGKQFVATLDNNETAQAFLKLLPLTLKMNELNRNEKYGELSRNLPTKSFVPDRINEGDLLLYGSNVVVLFYESFSTSYSYTSLGRIEDVKGLKEALGKGNVEVRFEREK